MRYYIETSCLLKYKALYCILMLSFASGCAEWLYSGDGTFASTGSYSRPYIIDLGEIGLSSPHNYNFRLSNMPASTLFIGLQVDETKANEVNLEKTKLPVVVGVVLKEANGNIVVDEQAELTNWVKSFAVGDKESFYYLRGQSVDIENENGSFTSKQINIKASGGWGTSFIPKSAQAYQLTIKIISSQIDKKARVIIQ